MITKKEFYFIRHGEGEHQIGDPNDMNAALTPRGREQAIALQNLMHKLGIQTVCHSPIRRAVETMELVIVGISPNRIEIEDLGECNEEVWHLMTKFGYKKGCEKVRSFMDQARHGVNAALEHPGPVLIVAHGGIHWAISSFMQMESELIGNCIPLHFKWEEEQWQIKHLQ